MPIELEIRKKPGNVWEYVKVNSSESYSSSKQHMTSTQTSVKFKEPYGNEFVDYDVSVIGVYDDTASSTEETYATVSLLADRLKSLGNPAFYRSGDLVIADLISSDPLNKLIIGTDGKLFVSSTTDGGTP